MTIETIPGLVASVGDAHLSVIVAYIGPGRGWRPSAPWWPWAAARSSCSPPRVVSHQADAAQTNPLE